MRAFTLHRPVKMTDRCICSRGWRGKLRPERAKLGHGKRLLRSANGPCALLFLATFAHALQWHLHHVSRAEWHIRLPDDAAAALVRGCRASCGCAPSPTRCRNPSNHPRRRVAAFALFRCLDSEVLCSIVFATSSRTLRSKRYRTRESTCASPSAVSTTSAASHRPIARPPPPNPTRGPLAQRALHLNCRHDGRQLPSASRARPACAPAGALSLGVGESRTSIAMNMPGATSCLLKPPSCYTDDNSVELSNC